MARSLKADALRGRFRDFQFWDGAVFGTFVSFSAAVATGWYFSNHTPEENIVWATLAAAPLAFLTLAGAIWIARYQMEYSRRRDLVAAKIVLPLALTRISRTCQEALEIIANTHQSPPRSLVSTARKLALDELVIQILRDNAQAADPVSRRWLEILVGRYQVYSARIEGWYGQPLPTQTSNGDTAFSYAREDALIDWATLYAITDHLFDYSRGVVESAPAEMDASRIKSAFFMHLYQLSFVPSFERRISTRIERLKPCTADKLGFDR